MGRFLCKMGLKIIFSCNFFSLSAKFCFIFFSSVTFQKCSNYFCFLVYICTIIAMDTQTNDVTQAVSKFASDLYTVKHRIDQFLSVNKS